MDASLTPRRRVTLVPRPGERVVARGEARNGTFEFDDPENGVYACFCTVEPVADKHVLAVVDGGMWPDTARSVRSLLPPLFTLYERRLGAKLPWRPTVFISGRTEGTGRSIDMGGGTLDGVIQLHFGLGPDLSPSEPAMLHAAMVQGRTDYGIMATGQVAGVIEDLPTVAELIERIMAQATSVLSSLSVLSGLSGRWEAADARG